MFEHQAEQVANDQVAYPLVQVFLEVARDVGVEQPRIQPLAHGQVAVNVGLFVMSKNGLNVEVFQEFVLFG